MGSIMFISSSSLKIFSSGTGFPLVASWLDWSEKKWRRLISTNLKKQTLLQLMLSKVRTAIKMRLGHLTKQLGISVLELKNQHRDYKMKLRSSAVLVAREYVKQLHACSIECTRSGWRPAPAGSVGSSPKQCGPLSQKPIGGWRGWTRSWWNDLKVGK